MTQGTPVQGRKWTIAEVAGANRAAGLFFFSPDTMKCFGDQVSSFSVVHAEGKVYVKRVKAPGKHPDRKEAAKLIGQLREFNPETGSIGPPLKYQDLPESLR